MEQSFSNQCFSICWRDAACSTRILTWAATKPSKQTACKQSHSEGIASRH